MKKFLMTAFMLALASSICYAAEGDEPAATEPVGAVIEATGVFVGKITSVIGESTTGGKIDTTVTVADESGKTKIFPVDETVKIVDATFNALTLDQLKEGKKVSVEYSKEGDSEKAKTVKVEE